METPSPEIKRGRGRPRSFDPDTVLKAAAERFRTHGFAGASLDDLADATGLNRPSLYAAFGDKKALYLAALDRMHSRIEGVFAGTLAAKLPHDALLPIVFGRTIDGYMTGEMGPSGCLAVGTASTEAARDPDIRAALARFIAMQDVRMAEILAQAGFARPEATARIVMATLHSLAVRARAGIPRAELDRLAADCIALIDAPPA